MIISVSYQLPLAFEMPSALELPSALADGLRRAELLALATYYGAKAEYSACFFPLTEVNVNRKKVIK